jgi:hypothetical protein
VAAPIHSACRLLFVWSSVSPCPLLILFLALEFVIKIIAESKFKDLHFQVSSLYPSDLKVHASINKRGFGILQHTISTRDSFKVWCPVNWVVWSSIIPLLLKNQNINKKKTNQKKLLSGFFYMQLIMTTIIFFGQFNL